MIKYSIGDKVLFVLPEPFTKEGMVVGISVGLFGNVDYRIEYEDGSTKVMWFSGSDVVRMK